MITLVSHVTGEDPNPLEHPKNNIFNTLWSSEEIHTPQLRDKVPFAMESIEEGE